MDIPSVNYSFITIHKVINQFGLKQMTWKYQTRDSLGVAKFNSITIPNNDILNNLYYLSVNKHHVAMLLGAESRLVTVGFQTPVA